ncbi:MAG: hypothetical protein K5983_00480 [Lactobacillus sp.]|nr:hypothetical protein [Lactobacillus sp.]
MKDLEKHFEDIKSGKIKDYAILGMDEKGEVTIHISGRGPVIDGLLHEAQIQADKNTNNQVLEHALKAFLDD